MDNMQNTVLRLERYNNDFQRALTNFTLCCAGPSRNESVAGMLTATSRLYATLADLSVDLADSAGDDKVTGLCLHCESIHTYAMVTADAYIIRVPNLPSKYSSFSRTHAAEYSAVFATEVRELTENADLSHLDLKMKHISIIGIYGVDHSKIPDADNLETKAIVDAITRYMPGGDDWNRCSFSSTNIKSDKIEPGTYFIVSPCFREPPSLMLQIAKLTELFKRIE